MAVGAMHMIVSLDEMLPQLYKLFSGIEQVFSFLLKVIESLQQTLIF